jgi:anti-anti-sigma regulatory factor
MELSVEHTQGQVPVTVLRVDGKVDGSNYEELIHSGEEQYKSGTRNLLLDLSLVSFLSSAGLVAIHRLALIMRGENKPVPESGWQAMHDVSSDLNQGKQSHLKLLNPQDKVMKSLNMAGFTDFFDVFYDREAAIASFH